MRKTTHSNISSERFIGTREFSAKIIKTLPHQWEVKGGDVLLLAAEYMIRDGKFIWWYNEKDLDLKNMNVTVQTIGKMSKDHQFKLEAATFVLENIIFKIFEI